MSRNKDRSDLKLMKCIVLAGITVGVAVTEVKRVIVIAKDYTKKVKAKLKSAAKNKHVD